MQRKLLALVAAILVAGGIVYVLASVPEAGPVSGVHGERSISISPDLKLVLHDASSEGVGGYFEAQIDGRWTRVTLDTGPARAIPARER